MESYQEKNKMTLREGIGALPAYSPPAELWDTIEAQLEGRENLQQAINELPQYTPPVRVWEQLETSLDQQTAPAATMRSLSGWSYRWAAAAAVAGILTVGAWLFLRTDAPAMTSIVYSEETFTAPPIDTDWEAEENSFALVLQQVDQSPVADPGTVHRLKLEYHELTDAREEVEQMMHRYGEDIDLLQEIARIERERSKVIKELASWI